jgi:hypothetical protein
MLGSLKSFVSGRSDGSLERLLEDAPEEFGLLIRLHEQDDEKNNESLSESDTSALVFQLVPDQYLPDIHPNCHGPASLRSVHLLSGGGSGVAVFAGEHPSIGKIVMKHGSDRDLVELFALAIISRELAERIKQTDRSNSSPLQAAEDMRRRIPEFRMIYCSPQHLYERPKETLVAFKSHEDFSRAEMDDDDDEPDMSNTSSSKSSTGSPSNRVQFSSNTKEADESGIEKSCSTSTLTGATSSSEGRTVSAGIGLEAETPSPTLAKRMVHIESFGNLIQGHLSQGSKEQEDYSHEMGSRKSWTNWSNSWRFGQSNQRTQQHNHGSIRLYKSLSTTQKAAVCVKYVSKDHSLKIKLISTMLPSKVGDPYSRVMNPHSTHWDDNGLDRLCYDDYEREQSIVCQGGTGGYTGLQAFVNDLLKLQKTKGFKFTMAQKTIGDSHPTTASALLAEGKLHGLLLDRLMDEFIRVIYDLQHLTKPSEIDVVDSLQTEVTACENDIMKLPFDISDQADAFVGFCIKKNWHPELGRFFLLRRIGHAFRSETLYLRQEEELPASVLGLLLHPCTLLNEVFVGAPARTTALATQGFAMDSWRSLLRAAISLKSPCARNRLWNCGLSDAGLHNMFLTTITTDLPQEEANPLLYLFDLGEPKLLPLPAFLTKFLFSFFHTLGMVDDAENGRGWVNRFQRANCGSSMLALTPETQRLLPKAYSSFKVAIDRLVKEFFDESEHKSVRKILVCYVTLQLLSDSAFCLQRWRKKGGGQARKSNHHKEIDEWLWRSIWDIFVASDLNSVKNLQSLGVKEHAKWMPPTKDPRRNTPTSC